MARGVYMIVAEDKIIYVGKTKRDFEIRFKEHKRAVEGFAQSYKIHQIIREYKEKGVQPHLMPLYVATEEDNDELIDHIEHLCYHFFYSPFLFSLITNRFKQIDI